MINLSKALEISLKLQPILPQISMLSSAEVRQMIIKLGYTNEEVDMYFQACQAFNTVVESQ